MPTSCRQSLPSSDVERAYLAIVRDRFSRTLPDQVSESDLVRRYGVSRSVLRNVLVRLVQEGLAQRRRGHGWQFLSMIDSLEADRESYEFRAAVEPAGLRSVHFKPDQAWLEKSKTEHERLIAGAIGNTTSADFFAMNAEFHETLAAFSGNRYFLQVVQQQNRPRRAVEYGSFPFHDQMLESCRQHLEIINALLENDREWAANLMFHHLTRSRQGSLPFRESPAAKPEAPAAGDETDGAIYSEPSLFSRGTQTVTYVIDGVNQALTFRLPIDLHPSAR